MPFSPQTFSVEEVLASSKMNQMDLNLDEVRRSHKAATAAPSPVAGVLWVDDSATPWIWKMFDGADWINLFTVHATNNSSGIGMEIISSGTVSAAATLDITDLLATYRAYIFVFDSLSPATDNVTFLMRTDANNGASFDAGATDYSWDNFGNTAANAHSGANAQYNASSITIGGAFSNVANEAASGHLIIHDPMDSATRTNVESRLVYILNNADFNQNVGAGHRNADQANNAVRFLFSSGNIATMNWTLYGMRKQ